MDDDSCMKKDKECFLLNNFLVLLLFQFCLHRFTRFRGVQCERWRQMTRSVPEQSGNGIRSPAENAKLT